MTSAPDDFGLNTALSWRHLLGRVGANPVVDSLRHPPQRDWRFDLTLRHNWGRSVGSPENMLKAMLSLYVPGWRFDLSEFGYNFAEMKFTNYKVGIWRDLHCWEALASVTGLGSQWKYDFEIRIKKLPDVKFGKGTFGEFLPGVQ